MAVVELRMDYDTPKWHEVERAFARGLDWLREIAVDGNVKKTGRGYHVSVFVRGTFSRSEVIDMQYALGDDRSRVRVNRLRAKHKAHAGRKNWNRFWQMKFTADGGLVSQEVVAEGETRWLLSVLFPTDGAFKK